MPRVRLKNSYKIHDPWWHFAHKFWVPNCCESRIMFSRTSVTQNMLQVESGVLPAAVVAKSYAEVSANKHQVPLFQRMFQTQECGTYATSITRFRASNLETLTQLTWAHHKLLGLWLPPGTFRNWNLRSGEGSERLIVSVSPLPKKNTESWQRRQKDITLSPQAVCLVALRFLQGSPTWVVKPIPLHGPGSIFHMYMARS